MPRPSYIVFLYLIVILFSTSVFSQQGNNWYFGNKAGITFNTNPPSALLDGQMQTNEGCASISDYNGKLLFYTDGRTVYNSVHQVMVNGSGLYGHSSAANSAIIIPKPGSNTIFYIFTADAAENSLNKLGYNYSEVDMSLNGGLGAVTTKNVPLYAPCSERLTAVRHANGIDIWVVTRHTQDNTWVVYLVTCNGVQPTPVISTAGLFGWTVGCLKGSPNGKKIATTDTGSNWWEIFDFDNNTGKISNFISQPLMRPYGIEFSPDSKLMYVAAEGDGQIHQYDLSVYDSTTIANSDDVVANNFTNGSYLTIGGLQLGPDNKIYCAVEFSNYLAVIDNPNTRGPACSYISKKIFLGTGQTIRTLPVFFSGLLTNLNADFSYTNGAGCGDINFSATTLITGTVTYNWDFGDGTTGTGKTITHNYGSGNGNTFTVKLTTTTAAVCGGTAITTKQINLNPAPPVANFGFIESCGNLNVLFHDSSMAGNNSPIRSWDWDFGDGNTSTDQHPSHTYLNYGSYTITLKASGLGCGNSNSIQKTVLLKPKPVADFANTKACIKEAISFSDMSVVNPNRPIKAWYWSFGDGSTSTQQNPQKTFTVPGSFQLKFAVVSSEDCASDTVTRTIQVNDPVAAFTSSTACVNEAINFNDKSAITSGTIAKWYWNFGNGNSSIQQNPSAIYNAPGSYIVKHVVETATGCVSDSAISTIQIDSKPLAAMGVIDGCQNQPEAFLDKSSNNTGNIVKWYWDFGNGTTGIVQNPSVVYATGGHYTIKMAVTTEHGCVSDTAFGKVNIESIPVVDFNFSNTCIGKEINFDNLSHNDFGAITHYKWSFGNGDSSDNAAPVYTYYRYNNYQVILTAATKNGCRASTSKTVIIAPVIVNAGNDTTAAMGQPVHLTASGAAQYVWWPSTYLNDPLIGDPVSTPYHDITYYLTGTTAEGCIGHDTILIKVYKGPDVYVPNAFAPNGKNKIFRPILAGIQQLYYFSIYNRYGQMIFTTQEPGKGWDGTVGGTLQSTGTFVWALKAKDYTGKIIQQKGTVTLIR